MRALLGLLGLLACVACREASQPRAAAHAERGLRVVADAGKPRADCYACHARDYRGAHQHEGVKPTRCAVCHVESGWHPVQISHPWPLTGAHVRASCFACHSGKPPVYEDTPDKCVDCHREDFDKSEYPGHDRFALTCLDCHTTEGWKPAKKPEKKAAPVEAKPSSSPDAPAPRPTPARAPARKSAPRKRAASAAPTVQPTAAPAAPAPAAPAPAPADKPKHPESKFPITSGNHTDIECETCHDGPGRMGKANADCVQCHKRSRFDRKHADITDYPSGAAPANFCVECHTRGTRRTR